MEKPVLAIDDHQRVYWHSRRGMLELDLVLMPFAQQDYAALSEADQHRYVNWLSCEDQDLFGWFLQHKTPDDEDLRSIIHLILERHHGRFATNTT